MSYARIFLAVAILMTVVAFLLNTIAGAIFGVFALWVLFIVIKEGL